MADAGEQCQLCRFFDGWADTGPDVNGSPTVLAVCVAFPAGIPWAIWSGQLDHEMAYPGDGGIRFELMPPGVPK